MSALRMPAKASWVMPSAFTSTERVGKGHMPILLATIALGGHIRVGMEDNVMYHKGILADSNAQFVARAKRLLEEAGLSAATPDEARAIYGLTRKVF